MRDSVGYLSWRVAWETRCRRCGIFMHFGLQAQIAASTCAYRCPYPTCNRLLRIGSFVEGTDWWQTKCSLTRCSGLVDTRGGVMGLQPRVYLLPSQATLRGPHVDIEGIGPRTIGNYLSRLHTLLLVSSPMPRPSPRLSP